MDSLLGDILRLDMGEYNLLVSVLNTPLHILHNSLQILCHFQLQQLHDNPYYMYDYHKPVVFHICVHKNMDAILHREIVQSHVYLSTALAWEQDMVDMVSLQFLL